MSQLQTQGEVNDDNETTNDSERGTPEENQLRNEALEKLNQMQSSGGMGQVRDFGDLNGRIDDKYNLEQNTDEIKKKMMEQKDDEDDKQDGFLKVYDEKKNAQNLDVD